MILAIVEQEESALRLSGEQIEEVGRRLEHPESVVTPEEADRFFKNLT
jgi:hypothetical protein